MKTISKYISNHSLFVVLLSIFLLIPATIGYMKTRINYDILIYLPEDVETIKGENILTDEFGLGAYAFVMVDNENIKKVLLLEDKIKSIKGVNQVVSINDVIDTTIPYEMLPDEIISKLYNKNETIVMVTFDGGISEDKTINSVRELRSLVDDASRVSSMTSMVIDTMDLSSQEMFLYVFIAIVFCFIILTIATDSYLVPVLLLSNIGIAILYNMGTNIFLGQISYITKAITAILQLGVTTDFSIFLYHKYEQEKASKKYKSNKEAMSEAITQTFKSVIGSSLTTFAGFLALCTMDLTLGMDIGIVMTKGVFCGLLCVLTLFPALLLVFDKQIEKLKHKNLFPTFEKLQKFSIKYFVGILVGFGILIIPAVIGNSNYLVYYKLDDALPSDLAFNVANSDLAKKFNIISPEIIIIDKDMKKDKVLSLVDDLKNVEGIDLVLSPTTLVDENTSSLLPDDIKKMVHNDKYQLIITNSVYELASNELNDQVVKISNLVKKYDKDGIIAGEGPLMKDLVTIADHDFKMVNYSSLLVIFIIMVLVLKSISLPIILVIAIEFAIFLNMSISYFTNTSLPFIASIVVGTIQLGATIDYAILMSTRYLEERVKTDNKKLAIQETLKYTVPSIITSALCFFAATIGVAIYTKIDMIGSICELLSRGSIISMFVVILILPSLLIVCDKIIIKYTLVRRERKKI